MKLKEFFSDSSKWTQGSSARDKRGKKVSPKNSHAVSFCLLGGVEKCYPETRNVLDKIQDELPEMITIWNDREERTFKDIKNLVNKLDI